MSPDILSTRYSDWGRGQARGALAVIFVVIGCFLSVAFRPVMLPVQDRGGDTDVDLFRKVVLRVHSGESTHDAFERVFKEYEYPVCSVFNYRTPLHPWLIGNLPSLSWGRAMLAAIILATTLIAYTSLRRHGSGPRAAFAVFLMLGVFAYCFVDDMYLYTEVWAGTLIVLSVCAYDLNHRWFAIAAGLIALFFRELALPYVLVAALIDWRQGRRRETLAWGTGLALYGLYLALHILAVAPRISPGSSLFHGSAWLNFEGIPFILATCRINLLLLVSPRWVAALYLPLSLVGLVGWRGETSLRIGTVIGLYLATFTVVGGLYNAYWGLLYAPLLPLGLVWAPASLRDLCSAAVSKEESHHSLLFREARGR
jgi:hypothetical protein